MPRVLLVALAVLLIPSSSFAPTQPVSALAPWDVVANGFDDLRGIAVDADGVLFVADHHAGTVTRITPNYSQRIVAKRLKRPIGLAFDATGRLLIAEEKAGRVVRLEANGTRTPIITRVKQPRWLAVGADGTVFLSARRLTRNADLEAEDDDDEAEDDNADPQVILAFTPGGRLTVFADGLRQVQGLAIGEDVLYAAMRGRWPGTHGDGAVVQIPILADGSAGPLTRLGPTGSFKHPVGLVRDRLGALYLTAKDLDHVKDPKLKGPQKQAIAKLHPNGTLTLFAARLEHPQGLAFDAEGNLLVTDGQRVLRFRAPPAPSFTGLAPVTNQSPLIVTGTAEPSARVDLFVNESVTPLTTTAAGGTFSLAVPLAANASNELEAFATGHGGRGLTGAAATATILDDGIAPDVVFLLPGAGDHVRQTVDVQARAADGGSGVATLTLTAGGQQLLALSPLPPAPSVTATASWQTSTLADGAYTLTASATDQAGNANVITRVVTVDNTPPDTTITEGPTGAINVADVTFTFTGTDILTPAANLVFAWRLDNGAWSAFQAATTATLTNLTLGLHTFEVKARDLAGNEDPTPARRDFTVGAGVSVTIASPADGATVPAGLLLVTGTVEANGAEVAIIVNGVPAAVEGTAFVTQVGVSGETSTLTAVATTAGGATAMHTIAVTVTRDAAAGGALLVTPQSGLGPLTVRFSLAGVSPRAVALDLDGDGTVDFTGVSLDDQSFTYTQPGLYFPMAIVTDAAGAQRVLRTVVQVHDRTAIDGVLRAKWNGMKSALARGDSEGALGFFTAAEQGRYRAIFAALSPHLGGIAQEIGDIELIYVIEGRAKYRLLRTQLWGGQLMTLTYYVSFVQDGSGFWRIEGF